MTTMPIPVRGREASPLEQVEHLARELENATGDLNAGIGIFESTLMEINPGVSWWINFDPSVNLGGWRFGWAKIKRCWGLLAQFQDQDAVRLVDAPREVRVAAVLRFEELATGMNERLKMMLTQVREAIKVLK